MSGSKVVFDTCAIILLLKGEYELSSLKIDIEGALQYISVISRMELMSKRNMKLEEEHALRSFIADVSVFPLDETIEQKAIELRRKTTLKLPDCIVVATSIVLDAILLTNDDEILKLSWPGLQTQHIPLSTADSP